MYYTVNFDETFWFKSKFVDKGKYTQYSAKSLAIKDAIERVKGSNEFKSRQKIRGKITCMDDCDFQKSDFFLNIYMQLERCADFEWIKGSKLVDDFNKTLAKTILEWAKGHHIKIYERIAEQEEIEIVNTHFGTVVLVDGKVYEYE